MPFWPYKVQVHIKVHDGGLRLDCVTCKLSTLRDIFMFDIIPVTLMIWERKYGNRMFSKNHHIWYPKLNHGTVKPWFSLGNQGAVNRGFTVYLGIFLIILQNEIQDLRKLNTKIFSDKLFHLVNNFSRAFES